MGKFNFIWLSCKQATFLVSKKQEGKLTSIETIQLKMHLRICSFCTRFEKQIKFFAKNAGKQHLHNHGTTLSTQKKEEIKSLLKEE